MEDGIRSAEDEFLTALDHMEAGEYALALPILGRLVAFEPTDDEIYETWIDAHIGLERYRRAVEIADAGIAQGRPRASLELWKAVAYRKLEQVEKAEAAARAALAAEPSFAAAIMLLSSILEQQNRHSEALEMWQRAAAENPDDEELAFQAISLADEMDLDQVVVDSARSYLKRFGKRAAVLAFLGSAYIDLKEYRKADRAFRDAAALEPDVADHHFNIVMLAEMRGDDAAADAYLDKLAARDEDLADRVAAAVDEILDLREEEGDPSS
ncbi:MAG: tetratricopeptide repeat protein [Acidobacteriota bacterium]